MQRVFVLANNKKPLMPCHPARAKELLKKGKAAVYRRVPFTIILKNRSDGDLQPIELKVDPGSKTSGITLVADFKRGNRGVFAANLSHRGQAVKAALETRRSLRRSRRARKTRYRAPRFKNRTRPQGWLPPSLMSRVGNVSSWAKKLQIFAPIKEIAVETVRFDMQKLVNPEVSGLEYQQGELFGYEVREYLLEKWGRKCVYCSVENVPLEIEHIVSKKAGGSNRVSNLTIACQRCNQAKGSMPIASFVKNPQLLQQILRGAQAPLKDAAAVNATRYAIGHALKSFTLPISFWSGGRTKFNRCKQSYKKDHWIDAACVGESGKKVFLDRYLKPLQIKAEGRGSRQMCLSDKFGFPRTAAKTAKRVHGFQTGDLVAAIVTKGKKIGRYFGRVAVRMTGNFNIKMEGKMVQGIAHKFCILVQRVDGYSYSLK